MKRNPGQRFWSQPSWVVVVLAGAVFIFFLAAIVREVLQGHQVRVQVQRLREEVATEQRKQDQLKDLIEYLGSPTFQEREARLKLGLKKSGERVIVVPPEAADEFAATDGSGSQTNAATTESLRQRWWRYFFGPREQSTS